MDKSEFQVKEERAMPALTEALFLLVFFRQEIIFCGF
jgi:hypothetical protein